MNVCCMTWQAVLNLMGRSQFKTRLIGEALKEDICKEEMKDSIAAIESLDVQKLILSSFYGEYESAAEYAYKNGDSPMKNLPGLPFIPIYTFHRCLSLLAMARILKEERCGNVKDVGKRKGKESKYIRLAKKILGKINHWAQEGHPQSKHYEPLLEAELAAYQGQSDIATEKYEMAVDTAVEDEFLQDVALANERYGLYLLCRCDDSQIGKSELTSTTTNETSSKEGAVVEGEMMVPSDTNNDDQVRRRKDAIFRIKESIKWYNEWGAHGKVKVLEKQYGKLIQNQIE